MGIYRNLCLWTTLVRSLRNPFTHLLEPEGFPTYQNILVIFFQLESLKWTMKEILNIDDPASSEDIHAVFFFFFFFSLFVLHFFTSLTCSNKGSFKKYVIHKMGFFDCLSPMWHCYFFSNPLCPVSFTKKWQTMTWSKKGILYMAT